MSTETASARLDEGFLREFTTGYETAWNGHDSAAIEAFLTPDIEWHDPALPAPARGLGEVRAFMETSWQAFPDLRFGQPDRPHLSVTGDLVAFAWRMEGTMEGPIDPPGFAPTGARMAVEGVDLWLMRDRRIAHYRAFYDRMGMAVQLGLMPGPGSTGEKATAGAQRLAMRAKRFRR